VTVNDIALDADDLGAIRELPSLLDLRYDEQSLHVRFGSDEHNLIRLLEILRQRGISFGRVFSERPTLNDVFLEITGTQLRD